MQLGRTDGAQLLSAPAIDLGQQGKSGSSFPMGMGGIWAKKQPSGGADFSRSPVVLVSGRHAPHRLWLEKVRRSPRRRLEWQGEARSQGPQGLTSLFQISISTMSDRS